MKEDGNKIKQIIVGIIIVLLIVALIVAVVNINKEKKMNSKLQDEINEIKNAIEMPEDTTQTENPDDAMETDAQ